jgi:hypothetical protein
MDEPRKKRSTKRHVLAADPRNNQIVGQIVGPPPDFGKMMLGQQVTPGRKLKRGRLLVAAIKKRLARGQRAPDDVPWKQFCDDIRDDCGAWIGDRKHQRTKRGFSDDTIERVARELMKSSYCQD